MRSINVKRVAAVAAGAAMIGSVMASGVFGAVSTSGDVNTLVSTIKANLGSTQVVVGTDGADISDGIQAAKIASTLSSLNYQVSTVADLTCDIGTPTVTVQTGAGDVARGTTSKVYAEYSANVGTANSNYITTAANKTITKTQFSDVLSERTLAATINSTAYTYTYEDRIELYNGQPKYSQSSSGTTTGHGLYYKINTGTSGARGIIYHVKFGGSGIPVTSNYGYQETPEIYIAGDLYGLDWQNTASGTLALQTGTKQTMLEGDSVTSEGYTITLTGIGATTTPSGTQYTAAFDITDGTTTQTGSVTEGSTGYYFQQSVSINVEDILYGTAAGNKAIVRIGTGTATFSTGSAWTGSGATSETAEWVVEAVSVTANKLTAIKLKYGNPSNLDMEYNFDGSYLKGLAEDTAINGPLMKSGTPFFQIELEGLGSQSTVIDSTDLTFEGVGSESDYSGYIKSTWTSRDGMTNIWNPGTPTYAKFSVNVTSDDNSSTTVGTHLNKSGGFAYWTIVNDKVVVFQNTPVQTTTGGRTWNAIFLIGGTSGTTVTVTGLNSSVENTGILDYASTVNPIYCNVSFHAANDVTLMPIAGYDGKVSYAVDNTSGLCDVYPDVITFGDAITIDATTGKAPYMDMRWIGGNYTAVSDTTGSAVGVNVTAGGSYEPWPFVLVNESTTGNYFAVVFDDDDTSGAADTYTGLRVTGGHTLADNTSEQSLVTTAGNSYINQAQQTKYESSLYQTTTLSTELDGSTQNLLTVTMPEAARNSLVKVESEITPGEIGEETVGEGDTVGNVEIISINAPDCTVSGTVTGDIYTVRSTLTPENLITTDTAATATYQIVVGGHYVNRVARTMSEAARNSISQAGAQYLIAESNKLMVAGYTATDTAAAANQLITLLKA